MSGANVHYKDTTTFNDGDQKTSKGAYIPPKFEEGQKNSHDVLDSKDERSIANRLEAAEQKGKEEKQKQDHLPDPTLPARNQGHEPSKGAKIDAELQKEEQEYLEKNGKA